MANTDTLQPSVIIMIDAVDKQQRVEDAGHCIETVHRVLQQFL